MSATERRIEVGEGAAARTASSLLVFVVAAALVVLVAGWGFGVDALVRGRAGLAATMPSTALAFVLVAASLLWIQLGPGGAAPALTAAAVIAIYALASLGARVFLSLKGFDALLPLGLPALPSDGTSPATSMCFLLASACLVALATGRGVRLLTVCATLGLTAGLIAVTGYAFGAQALYRSQLFTAMGLPTAIGFVALFIAVMLLRPTRGWIGVLIGPGPGSAGARRMAPVVVLTPVVLSAAVLFLRRNGLADPDFRLSLYMVILITILAVAVLRNADLENRTAALLAERAEELTRALQRNQLLLREVYHRVRNNLQQVNALLLIEAGPTPDPQVRAGFDATANRIVALSRVHSIMVSSTDEARLGLGVFLNDLCGVLGRSRAGGPASVRAVVDGDDLMLDVDTAVSLGLLINELIGPDRPDSGYVEVRLTRREARCKVRIVHASGAPAPPPTEASRRIIRALVAQLGGEPNEADVDARTVSLRMARRLQEEQRDV